MKRKGVVQQNPLLLPVVFLIVGMVCGSKSTFFTSPLVWLCSAGVVALLALLVGKWRRWGRYALWLMVLLLGAAMMNREEQRAQSTLPTHEVSYRAVVISEPVVHGKVVRMDLLVTDGLMPMKVKASLLRDTVENRYRLLHLGDGIEASSLLERPQTNENASFDYARWLSVHDYSAQTFIYMLNWCKTSVNLTRLSPTDKLRYEALLLRQRLVDSYHDVALRVGADNTSRAQLGVVAAMTLGDKSLLPRDLKDVYSVVGSSHVLALSGLHLSILYGLLSLLMFRRRRQWVVQGILLTAIWMYVFLVGMPVSIVRSALMLSAYSLMTLSGRSKSPLNTLAFAALIVLVLHPFALYDIGFQLSFLAVLSLMLFYRPLSHWLLPEIITRSKVMKPVADIGIVALAAQIGTAPLVVYYFGRFSCCFLLANYIVTPCAAVILFCGLLSLLMIPFPLLQELLMRFLLWMVGVQNEVLSWLSSFSWASIEGIRLSAIQVILVYVVIAALSMLVYKICRVGKNPESMHAAVE